MVRILDIIITIVVLVGTLGTVNSQSTVEHDSIIEFGDCVVEQFPSLGNTSFEEFIDSVLVYPLSAIQDSLQGVVFVSCRIDKEGNAFNHHVLKGLSDDLNMEAIRIVKLMKFREPAKHRGRPVMVDYVIPVRFNLKNVSSNYY